MKKYIIIALVICIALTTSCQKQKLHTQIAQHLNVEKSEICIESIDTVYVRTTALTSFAFVVGHTQNELAQKFFDAKTKKEYKHLIKEGNAIYDSLNIRLEELFDEVNNPELDSNGNHLRVTFRKGFYSPHVYININSGEIKDIYNNNYEDLKRCRAAMFNFKNYLSNRNIHMLEMR